MVDKVDLDFREMPNEVALIVDLSTYALGGGLRISARNFVIAYVIVTLFTWIMAFEYYRGRT